MDNDQLIKNTLKNFDFEKVSRVMNFLDWKYFGDDHPPTPESLKKDLKRLLHKILEEDDSNAISCGGFIVRKKKFTECTSLEAIFCIERWEEINK